MQFAAKNGQCHTVMLAIKGLSDIFSQCQWEFEVGHPVGRDTAFTTAVCWSYRPSCEYLFIVINLLLLRRTLHITVRSYRGPVTGRVECVLSVGSMCNIVTVPYNINIFTVLLLYSGFVFSPEQWVALEELVMVPVCACVVYKSQDTCQSLFLHSLFIL